MLKERERAALAVISGKLVNIQCELRNVQEKLDGQPEAAPVEFAADDIDGILDNINIAMDGKATEPAFRSVMEE